MAPADNAPYRLVYWPGVPGRGEMVRLLFEEAGVPYEDVAKMGSRDDVIAAVIAETTGGGRGSGSNPPLLACPLLKHGDLVLNQTPNIMMYLAPRLGLAGGDAAAPDVLSPDLLHLNGIVLTLLDGFVNEVHETHHPVDIMSFYEDQKPEARRRARAFRQHRLPKFMTYVQRLLDAAAADGSAKWLYGGTLTYADLVLFQCVDGTAYAFPQTMQKLRASGDYDAVFRLYEAIKARPRIKAYLASDRRAAYDDGIWRRYPELEED